MAGFKTMEQVQAVEIEKLKRQIAEIHFELIAATARLLMNGIDINSREQMKAEDMCHLYNAGDFVKTQFPDIAIPSIAVRPFLCGH